MDKKLYNFINWLKTELKKTGVAEKIINKIGHPDSGFKFSHSGLNEVLIEYKPFNDIKGKTRWPDQDFILNKNGAEVAAIWIIRIVRLAGIRVFK